MSQEFSQLFFKGWILVACKGSLVLFTSRVNVRCNLEKENEHLILISNQLESSLPPLFHALIFVFLFFNEGEQDKQGDAINILRAGKRRALLVEKAVAGGCQDTALHQG